MGGAKKDEILNFLKNHKNEYKQKYNISKLALFGSYARNEANSNSDIDIVIETPLSDYFLLFDLKENLEKAFNLKVDLIRLRKNMNKSLKKRIDKEALYV